ncbi:hypothetical protein FB45DRAFT_932984, partial [Roridomyces roridus]
MRYATDAVRTTHIKRRFVRIRSTFVTPMSSPTPSSSGSGKLRRTILACSHCRKRKIRCITSEQPPTKPCSRCKAKNLPCLYVSADARSHSPTSSNSPESDLGDSESSPPSTATATDPMGMPTKNRRSSPTMLSVPSFHRTPYSSSSSPTDPRRAIRPHLQPHPQPPLSVLYDMQAMHARQYLDVRTAAPQSHVPMTGIQPQRPPENYGAHSPLQGDVLLDFWTHGLGGGSSWHGFSPANNYESLGSPW